MISTTMVVMDGDVMVAGGPSGDAQPTLLGSNTTIFGDSFYH